MWHETHFSTYCALRSHLNFALFTSPSFPSSHSEIHVYFVHVLLCWAKLLLCWANLLLGLSPFDSAIWLSTTVKYVQMYPFHIQRHHYFSIVSLFFCLTALYILRFCLETTALIAVLWVSIVRSREYQVIVAYLSKTLLGLVA